MESRKHLYVSRNHFTVWLMALCMLGSVISRIVLFSGNGVWSGAVWPCVAAVLYGFYYAGVIKYFLRILSHPDVLDIPPETIERDIP